MRFLIYSLIALAIALTSLAALAQPYRLPTPTQVSERQAKQHFLNVKFPGALGVPPECKWSRIDPSKPPAALNFRLTCSPIEILKR